MKPLLSAWVAVALLAFTTTSCLAAATLTQKIDPPEVNVGDQAIVTITVQNGSVDALNLPQVDGLDVVGTQSATNITFSNGSLSRAMSINFAVAPSRAGTFTIPAFDIHTQEGDVLHVKAMKLHVLDNGASSSTNTAPAQAVPSPAPSSNPSANTPFNSNGPVVMPPANANANATGNSSDTTTGNTLNVPVESDGRPAKVFMVITPDTTDAYVGQSITLRITWYIRQDVDYQQDSLPTIKGSDFLMNDLSYRPHEEEQAIMNEVYRCESWVTAISAPKSGNFPLLMERDSYWVKSITHNNLDPFFGGFFNRRPNLAHESISSNQLTIHVHDLPTEGRPANFTGAIGQLKVTSAAEPASVNVGDPVTLHFSVSGEGNFNYVRCPTLASDPAWKTYVPSFKIDYLGDESHTQAVKTFDQSVIPLKNGNIPLPPASFSYFDPTTKQYVTVPIALPEITVTGTPIPLASTAPVSGTDSTTAATPTADFLPNRLEIGSPQLSLTPVYRQPWFWAIQGGLLFLTLLSAIFLFLRSRSTPDDNRAARAARQRSQQQEEDAMAEAVRRNDVVAFFVAARHAVRLQLGTQWNLKPEALTLTEIRNRDPHLAEALEPFFAQADEVIYSGQASSGLDLAQWEHRVRTELLQPQPA